MNKCCLFNYNSIDKAFIDRLYDTIETIDNLGGNGEGYSWADGSRKLCRCRNCGALFLEYKIKFLSMGFDSDEIRYIYYLPVEDRSQALYYCEKYICSAGLSSYKGKKIWFDGMKWTWKK